MAEEETQTTLRDDYEQAFETLETPTEPKGEPAPVSQPAPSGEAISPEGPADKERARDPETGKFVKGETKEPKEPKAPTSQTPVTQAAAAPQVPAQSALPRPSSWKKELEPQWASLPPEVQKYVLQREGEFASGVSTYKKEWDVAKPVLDAIAPYKPVLDQFGLKADQHVAQLLQTHHTLVMGTPQQKAALVARIVQNSGVPIESLFQQGQDGRLYLNQQLAQTPPVQAPQAQQPDVESIVEQKLIMRDAARAHEQFMSEVPVKFKHYEEVKETMARLLEAGFARDYPDAYDRALRMPEHSSLFEADALQRRQAEEAEQNRQKQEAALRARRNNISPRSATPASTGKPKGDTKSLRGSYEEAFEDVTAERV